MLDFICVKYLNTLNKSAFISTKKLYVKKITQLIILKIDAISVFSSKRPFEGILWQTQASYGS